MNLFWLLLFSINTLSSQTTLLRLQEEVSLIANELRNVPIDHKEPIETISRRLVKETQRLKMTPLRSPDLISVLNHLQNLFQDFPRRAYCKEYPVGMVKAIARQLEFSSQEASLVEELPGRLIQDLVLPVEPERLFPINLTLAKFKKLGPIIIFLMKHRISAPSAYQPIDPIEMVRGRYLAATGIMLEGAVRNVHRIASDGDIVFDISAIHCEITPSWQLIRPITTPKNGDKVRVYGWSYYDIFHEDESQDEKELARGRPTVWEIHPVTKIEILDNSSQ